MSGDEVARAFLDDPDQFGHSWPSAQFGEQARAANAKAAELTSEDWLRIRQEERDADRAGTHPGTSPEPREVSRNPIKPSKIEINPRTGTLTVASKNAAEKAHRRQAYHDRWGK